MLIPFLSRSCSVHSYAQNSIFHNNAERSPEQHSSLIMTANIQTTVKNAKEDSQTWFFALFFGRHISRLIHSPCAHSTTDFIFTDKTKARTVKASDLRSRSAYHHLNSVNLKINILYKNRNKMEIIATNACATMHVYNRRAAFNTMIMRDTHCTGSSTISYTLDSIVKGCVTCARSELFLFTSKILSFSCFFSLFLWTFDVFQVKYSAIGIVF